MLELSANYPGDLPRLIDSPLVVPVQRLSPNATLPVMGSKGAAAVDLCCISAGYISMGNQKVVDVGLAFAIPEGYVGLICSRSGLAAKNSVFVLNAPGVIDSDYRGPVKLIMMNAGFSDFGFQVGDRIAQMMFIKHENAVFEEVNNLTETLRGTGGFGSTGIASLN